MMNGIHGILLMGTGILHLVFGLLPFTYKNEWYSFFRLGFWKTVSLKSAKNMAAFWFIIAAPLFFILGLAVYELERQTGSLPQSIGWALLFLSVIGSVMTPKSGFTLLILPQAIFYLFESV